ncbi:MAG: hypothetical protein OXU35_03275 [Acidobacteriota bacterium]|nr:hypothetical protein [Acidobacteriota bacterium]MDE3260831.1 hypothetical protein [Acidobacteriota bacterium]
MTILALLLAALTAVLVPGGLYLATVDAPSSSPARRRPAPSTR